MCYCDIPWSHGQVTGADVGPADIYPSRVLWSEMTTGEGSCCPFNAVTVNLVYSVTDKVSSLWRSSIWPIVEVSHIWTQPGSRAIPCRSEIVNVILWLCSSTFASTLAAEPGARPCGILTKFYSYWKLSSECQISSKFMYFQMAGLYCWCDWSCGL